jgi:hypothetical protein
MMMSLNYIQTNKHTTFLNYSLLGPCVITEYCLFLRHLSGFVEPVITNLRLKW